jgi:hypothetical protein
MGFLKFVKGENLELPIFYQVSKIKRGGRLFLSAPQEERG